MDKVYLAHKGKIVEHKVLLEDGDRFYIDRLDDHRFVIYIKDYELGVSFFKTFEQAQEARIKKIKDLINAFGEELENITSQSEAIKGDLKPLEKNE